MRFLPFFFVIARKFWNKGGHNTLISCLTVVYILLAWLICVWILIKGYTLNSTLRLCSSLSIAGAVWGEQLRGVDPRRRRNGDEVIKFFGEFPLLLFLDGSSLFSMKAASSWMNIPVEQQAKQSTYIIHLFFFN